MEWTLTDGTKIELGYSGSAFGPGSGGQHVSRGYPWYRVNGGSWEMSPFRTPVQFKDWVESCSDLADFLEAVRIAEAE